MLQKSNITQNTKSIVYKKDVTNKIRIFAFGLGLNKHIWLIYMIEDIFLN